MSNKQSYAAVVAKPAQDGAGEAGSSGQQAEAPPPYTAPNPFQPHQTHLPPQSQPQTALLQHQQGYPQGTTESYHPFSESGWTPPPNLGVAKSRALRRFWMAFLYAWLIWIAIGLLIGGGISDVETSPPGRHGHWDKHGDWHGDKWSAARLMSKGRAEETE